MTDRREDVLTRLVAIGVGLVGADNSLRNVVDISELDRPAIIVHDGDEEASDTQFSNPSRKGLAANLVTMTPSVSILLSETSDDVGPALNAKRAALIKAVLGDSTLKDICGENGAIRYTASAASFNGSSAIAGEIGVSFAITYPLIPREL